MTHYKVKVEDIVKRKHVIKQKCKSPLREDRFYFYVAEGIDLPVIAVPIDLPVYRMANYRTRTRQKAYIHKHNKKSEYFLKGEEDTSAQKAQHEILVELANRGSGESIISIVRKFQQDQRQTEAILLTHEGVVVNGNRRLAAMRELYTEDADAYRTFEYVQALILPESVTVSELRKIEVQLQMQQETKLPYDWTDECIAVRDLLLSGMSKQEIMRLMRLEKETDVQAMIDRVSEAEMYLTDYIGNPDAYDAIEDKKQLFVELQKALDKKSDKGERELARKLCYVITKHSREFETRAYDVKIAFGSKTKEVADRLAERLDIKLPDPPAEKTDDDDIFGGDSDDSPISVRYAPLKTVLAKKSQSKQLAEAIKEICSEVREEDDDQDKARKPLRDVRKARAMLGRVDLQAAGKSTIVDLRAELEQIAALIKAMIKDLK